MTANERIRILRESLHESQEQFGNSIGISKSGVSNIESGIRNVTEKHIKLICAAYSVNENWLRDGTGEMLIQNDNTIISEVAAQYHLGDMDKELLRIFLELAPEQRQAVKSFAFALVDSVLQNPALYQEYRGTKIKETPLLFAARSGDASNLDEAAELFDQAGQKVDE